MTSLSPDKNTESLLALPLPMNTERSGSWLDIYLEHKLCLKEWHHFAVSARAVAATLWVPPGPLYMPPRCRCRLNLQVSLPNKRSAHVCWDGSACNVSSFHIASAAHTLHQTAGLRRSGHYFLAFDTFNLHRQHSSPPANPGAGPGRVGSAA